MILRMSPSVRKSEIYDLRSYSVKQSILRALRWARVIGVQGFRYSKLKRICKLSDGKLSRSLKRLIEEGLVYHGPRSRKYYITKRGLEWLKVPDGYYFIFLLENEAKKCYSNPYIARRFLGKKIAESSTAVLRYYFVTALKYALAYAKRPITKLA
jgi:hypothetical protein